MCRYIDWEDNYVNNKSFILNMCIVIILLFIMIVNN